MLQINVVYMCVYVYLIIIGCGVEIQNLGTNLCGWPSKLLKIIGRGNQDKEKC